MKNFIKKRLAGDDFSTTVIQSGFTILTRVLGALSGLLLNLVVARTLIPENAGEFFILLSLALTAGQISTLGLGTALLRFVGIVYAEKNYRLLNQYFSACMFMVILTSLAFVFLLFHAAAGVAYYLLDESVSHLNIKTICYAIPSIAIHALFISVFQSVSRPVMGLLFQAVLQPLLFCLLCVLFPADLSGTIKFYVISCLLTTPLAFGAWFRFQFTALSTFDKQTLRAFRSVWVSFFWISIVGIALSQLPLLAASNLIAKEQVAQLSVSLRVAGLTAFVLMACNMVLAPQFSRLHSKQDIAALSVLAKKGTGLMLILAAPLVSVLILFPSQILSLFGEGYRDAAFMLQILAFGQFCNVATGSTGNLLMMTGHQADFNKMQWLNLLALIFCLFIGSYLNLGASWLALSICIGVVLQNVGAYLMVFKRLGFSTIPGVERLLYRSGE